MQDKILGLNVVARCLCWTTPKLLMWNVKNKQGGPGDATQIFSAEHLEGIKTKVEGHQNEGWKASKRRLKGIKTKVEGHQNEGWKASKRRLKGIKTKVEGHQNEGWRASKRRLKNFKTKVESIKSGLPSNTLMTWIQSSSGWETLQSIWHKFTLLESGKSNGLT